jgi:hypothetical protein
VLRGPTLLPTMGKEILVFLSNAVIGFSYQDLLLLFLIVGDHFQLNHNYRRFPRIFD